LADLRGAWDSTGPAIERQSEPQKKFLEFREIAYLPERRSRGLVRKGSGRAVDNSTPDYFQILDRDRMEV
jgi:hypothetical protein